MGIVKLLWPLDRIRKASGALRGGGRRLVLSLPARQPALCLPRAGRMSMSSRAFSRASNVKDGDRKAVPNFFCVVPLPSRA